MPDTADTNAIDLSMVVIGYNEAAMLGPCLRSCRAIAADGLKTELIYVDGGSSDESVPLARAEAPDAILGGERRRRAAENRNLGLHHARGRYIQFVDGDMVLDPEWPALAMGVLETHPWVAAVFGRLHEVRETAFYRALQIDWQYPEGPALYVGGAALHRTASLRAAGGFPEDVAYGEEPLLCWRYRNELGQGIWHLHHTMADHDLAYRGFGDYWRRTVRVGETYAEVTSRCTDSVDPFWRRETAGNLRWFGVISGALALAVVLPGWWRMLPLAALGAVVGRKTVQGLRWGVGLKVALVYAAHTYLSKLAIGWGILRWRLRRRA